MCGRFSLASAPEELRAEFGIDVVPADYRARYNVAPSQPVLALTANRQRELRAGLVGWGLLPHWAADPSARRFINARAETLERKPAFRDAMRWGRRCLILADGFYEWRRESRRRIPMRVRLTSGAPFAMAGVWDRWNPPDGPPVYSCAIVTVPAHPALRQIHDRMPALIPSEARLPWLDREGAVAAALALLQPYPGDDLEAYAVSPLVNSPANDTPECVEPV